MPPYYLVFNHDVTDQEMSGQYGQAVMPTLMQYGAKVFVNNQAQNEIEGNSGRSLLVMEFESEAAAIRWYDSPEIQAITNLRIGATAGWSGGRLIL